MPSKDKPPPNIIVENSKFLSKYYTFNYPNEEIMNNLLVKDNGIRGIVATLDFNILEI